MVGVADGSSVHSICITNSLQSYGGHSEEGRMKGGSLSTNISFSWLYVSLQCFILGYACSHAFNPRFKVTYCDGSCRKVHQEISEMFRRLGSSVFFYNVDKGTPRKEHLGDLVELLHKSI